MSSPKIASGAAAPSLSQKLDELFRPWDRDDAPGLTVGVSHKGNVIYRRGFGLASIEHAVANTPSMRMRIGSTSKHFCSLGIMLLAEDGKLDINKPVREYLPHLGEVCGKPSLLQLMQHTGGLHDAMVLSAFQCGGHLMQLAPGATLQMLAKIKECNFEPGKRFAYSNSGYTLLSLVIEQISGKSSEKFFEERVFLPVGMTSTMLLRSDLDIVPNMATLHVQWPGGAWRRGIYPTDELMGSGGIISTVDDMLTWAAHLRGKDRKIGSSSTWERMFEPQTFPSGVSNGYSLGLAMDDHRGVKTIHHAGATLGSTHQMLVAPEHELDIVVMSNRMDVPSAALALKILELVLENDGLGPKVFPPAASGYPAIQGRWFSRSSKTLIEVAARKLHPDLPELLAFSMYDSFVGVLKNSGGGLALPAGGQSTVEFRSPQQGGNPPASLDVHICGEPERFERLPEAPPAVDALAPILCGRYRMPGYTKEFEIVLREGKLVLDLLPLHGQVAFELQPYSDGVVGCSPLPSIPHDPLPGNFALALDRQDGMVSGFWLSSDRMRNVRFDRVPAEHE